MSDETAHRLNVVFCVFGLALSGILLTVSTVLGGVLGGWYLVSGGISIRALDRIKRDRTAAA